MSPDLAVDRCRRRPDCKRLLVYLDTSTFGELADGNSAARPLAEVLERAIERQQAICVGSPWHDDEFTGLAWADQHVKTLRTYTLNLRMHHMHELIARELRAAAREFSGLPEEPRWREAFCHNPDDPPLETFQARYLNGRGRLEEPAALRAEVEHDRRTSKALTDHHLELREARLTWTQVALANVDAQVRYLLGPLAQPAFAEEAKARQASLAKEWLRSGMNMDPGSPTRKYLRFAELADFSNQLRENFPAVADNPAGFCASDSVRHLPTIRLFSFLLASLSVDGRQTKPSASDLHDLRHLTYGLSRCDVVTADKRSCALARGRNLVPASVHLVEATKFEEIARAVEQRLGT